MTITLKARKPLYLTPENRTVYFKVKQIGFSDRNYIKRC